MNDSGELILVSLHIGAWDGKKLDRDASADVTMRAGASEDAAKVTKQVVSKGWFKPIEQAAGRVRQLQRKRTLPWADDGTRLLAMGAGGAYFFEFEAEMLMAVDEWRGIVDEQLDIYDDEVVAAQANAHRMGTLFDASDYPPVDQLKRRFYLTLNYSTIPAPDAFDKYNVLGMEVDRIKANVEERVNLQMEAAIKDSWVQLYKAVTKMADRLASDGRLYDSVLGNLAELVHMLKAMNVGNDPQLEQMRAQIEMRLCQHDMSEVRGDEELKQSLAAEAKAMASDLAAFI